MRPLITPLDLTNENPIHRTVPTYDEDNLSIDELHDLQTLFKMPHGEFQWSGRRIHGMNNM